MAQRSPGPDPSQQRPRRGRAAEQPTAKARLVISLRPTGHVETKGDFTVPASQSGALIRAFERLSMAVVGAGLLVGTFYGAAAAHLPPTYTTVIVGMELLLGAGTALRMRRRGRRRQTK